MKRTVKTIALLLTTLLLSLSLLAGCGGADPGTDSGTQDSGQTQEQQYDDQERSAEESETGEDAAKDTPVPEEDGIYTSKKDVALYLYTYHRLPENYITKKEAQNLGWDGGSLEPYAPGKCIGGDRFGNYEGTLPEDVSYRECDIDTLGKKKRGAKRIVYSEDWKIYYTDDHYETFERLY